jgi:DNA segregation ATPase FtsK/SpoIIIE, S-DNA-T family
MKFRKIKGHFRRIRTKEGGQRQIYVQPSRGHNVRKPYRGEDLILVGYLLEGIAHILGLVLKALLLLILWVWSVALRGAKLFIEGWHSAAHETRDSDSQEAHRSVRQDQSFGDGRAALATLVPTDEDTPKEVNAKLEALLERGTREGFDPLTIRKIRDFAQEHQRKMALSQPDVKAQAIESGSSDLPQSIVASAPDVDSALPNGEGVAAESVSGMAESRVVYDDYQLPDLDAIFPTTPVQALEFTEEELLEQKQLLEDQLNSYRVRGKVISIHPGPVITRYEVELAPGEKVNRISGLAEDLAFGLRAKRINILVPIPGTSLVGIDVPNKRRQLIHFKEVFASENISVMNDALMVVLGKNISGNPLVADLARAPHLLIAGQVGSGKSMFVNCVLASLLASKSPKQLRMILVDPNQGGLELYENIPHLLGPVITKPEDAVQALKWATLKMDERYDKLAKSGVRNIKGFNEKVRAGLIREDHLYHQAEEFGDGVVVRYTDEETESGESGVASPSGEEMPYVLIVIDELADLMMVAGKEVETNIARIAQKARAVGIHLILATQRPSTNVITGTIKANLPTRIAFQVASQIDARTILDRQGAEKLLGRGDMLFRPIESPEPERLHGCFIDDKQCEDISDACSGQNVNFPKVRTFNVEEEFAGGGGEDDERDEKFIDAAEMVVQLKQASVSLLQRRLGVGYAKAGRIVDQLERAGIVGRERGSKGREVLMNEEELQSFLRSHEATGGL